MEDKELTQKFQMFEQQIRAIQQQLQAVEQALQEMNSLNSGLGELVGKKDKDILAPIGRGIFVNAKLMSEELMVDVGDKNFVKKSISETKKMIEDQVGKLENAKEELNSELEKINEELTKTFIESQKCKGENSSKQ